MNEINIWIAILGSYEIKYYQLRQDCATGNTGDCIDIQHILEECGLQPLIGISFKTFDMCRDVTGEGKG